VEEDPVLPETVSPSGTRLTPDGRAAISRITVSASASGLGV
jgi:hypothetical protein